MHDLKLEGREGIRQALTYILPQLNAQPTVAGFSPTQWVLGYQPAQPGLLQSSSCALHEHETFEKHLHQRNVAKTAILQAESDRKLRRALLRRYSGVNQRLLAGQRCFYWRDAQQHELCEIRWRGPAKVVCVEEKDGSPHVYWLAHKTQLIRAAPHHVRPDFTAIEETAVENLKDAASTLQSLKSRGVTRFLDLNRANKQDLLDVEEHEEEMSPHEGPEHKRRRLDAAIDDSLEDYTPSEPAEPTDEVDTPGNPSFPAAAPVASTAPESPERPAIPEHLLPAVPEHLDEMSDQPEPSIEPEPPSAPTSRKPCPLVQDDHGIMSNQAHMQSLLTKLVRWCLKSRTLTQPLSLMAGPSTRTNNSLELKQKLADFWEVKGMPHSPSCTTTVKEVSSRRSG